MSCHPVFTAISFDPAMDDVQSTVTQPLLHDELSLEEEGEEQPPKETTPPPSCGARMITLGTLTGFFIQNVSLAAYAFLVSHYGISEDSDAEGSWWVCLLLTLLAQIDLGIYLLIWVAFSCTMSQSGMRFIRDQLRVRVHRRSVFLTGVQFLVGIVLGAFLSWTLIDMYLGYPVPFLPIIGTVVVDLALCYMMLCCYDMGSTTRDAALPSHH
eukprot:Nitzschia sp. Nitz4//scaffold129_size63868//45539//46174//NITZ4_006202-RA/size63868-processed-gene-0.70-mRNA-1//-1//CDS//3329534914//2072//frame0